MDVESEIFRRIAASGPLTFAEFMDLALYHPHGGYYPSGDRIGEAGDFYTSPVVHPAFGTLMAVQLFQMWWLLDRPRPFTIVEPGSGNGQLCRDIITATAGIDEAFAESLRYLCIDRRPSASVEPWPNRATRIASNTVPLRGLVGCVISNELLDAMPVHQVTSVGGRLREIYVTMKGNDLATTTGEPSTPLLARRLAQLDVKLQEGQVAEVNLGLDKWARDVSHALHRGFVLTVDYGRTAAELYSSSERFHGTLTTFRGHLQTDSPLKHVGRQDISAQVDFTSVSGAGRRAGLDPLGYGTQAGFLHNLGISNLMQRTTQGSLRELQTSRTGLRELVRQGGLGEFKVMVQGKNAGQPDLWGFNGSEDATSVVNTIPVPMPTLRHIDLLTGRYPASETEFEVSWDDLWPAHPSP